MKKSIITLGILCAVFAGCKQKPNEPDKEKFEPVLMEAMEAWEQQQSQENQVITTILSRSTA